MTSMEEASSIAEDYLFSSALGVDDDNEAIHKEDIANDDIEEVEEELLAMEIDEIDQVAADDFEVEEEASAKPIVKISYEAKLRELLRNLYSIEVKIYSEASKEFLKLLRGDSGGDLLNQYVQASPLCSELVEAWKLRQGKPGISHVLSLISAILLHPDGKYKSDDLGRITLSRRLDRLARSIIETKLEDVYTELNSKEARRQNAALSLMAAIVRRGVGLASEVAKHFNFKLPTFPKLAEYQKKVVGKKGKYSTRQSFIEFAMSFLEIGNPRLLRWILQQKDMYFGVLRGLGSDVDDIIIYVLSTLRDKVLTPDSLVPPGLRSVLFGSVTLDQLVIISGHPECGPAAKIAYEVLVMVSTDPQNGLMPDLKAHPNPLKGNQRRLMELMKKLKATEIGYHRDLLLAIVNGRPSLGSAYMDKFPYDLEPDSSSTWFSAISLATDLVSSSRTSFLFGSPTSQPRDPPCIDSSEVQCLLKCIVPPAFSRNVCNRGLLYQDVLVRHGSIRFLVEALKSLDSLLDDIDCFSCSRNPMLQKWTCFKQEIQDTARALLPDFQVLLQLLSSLRESDSRNHKLGLKRPRRLEELDIHHMNDVKKLKSDIDPHKRKFDVVEDNDILISGINMEVDNGIPIEIGNDTGTKELENEKDHVKAGIRGLDNLSVHGNEVKDTEMFIHFKLLDVLTLYLRTMPVALEGSFDFFILLQDKSFTLSTTLTQSLLSLLLEYIGASPGSRASSIRLPKMMYKHLPSLISLLVFSSVKGIHDQAYELVRLAILSTGGFGRNHMEIDAWLLFLPGYRRNKSSEECPGEEVFQDLSAVVSFLYDALSTMAKSVYKYIGQLRGTEDASLDFSPLFFCILNKCLRLLDSDSETFNPHAKSMIAIYVSNTLCFILQTQVDGKLLSDHINMILTERFGDCSSVSDDSANTQWRPLKNLLLFSRSISLNKARHTLCSDAQNISNVRSPFPKTLGDTVKIIRKPSHDSLVQVAKAFCSSIICATPDEIVDNFPSVITVTEHLLGAQMSFLSCIFFHEQSLLARVADLWPELLFSGLKLVQASVATKRRKGDTCLLTTNDLSPPEAVVSSKDFYSIEAASVAFSSFLKQAPFSVLFPSIIRGGSNLCASTEIRDFLKAKLTEGSPNDYVASLRLLLFWVHQLQLSYRLEPSEKLQQLSGTCFILVKHILAHLWVVRSDVSSSKIVESPIPVGYIQLVAETIFRHPAVTVSLFQPLSYTQNLTGGRLEQSLENTLSSQEEGTNLIDNYILQILTEVADHFLALGSYQSSVSEVDDAVHKRILKALKSLIQQVVFVFKHKFDVCIKSRDLVPLLPAYYTLRALIRFISPFMLLELVHWMFCKIESKSLVGLESFFSIGCYIANGAFDLLSSYLHQINMETVRFCMLWQVEVGSSDIFFFEKVYQKVIEFAKNCKLECADLCLLKALKVVYGKKFMQPQTALPLSIMAIWRVIMNSPIDMLNHCIHGTNRTRGKLLFVLTELSPLHLTRFGQILSCITSKDVPQKASTNHALTEEFLMLLPVALAYLDLHFVKQGACFLKHFRNIPSFYSKFLLDGFISWKSYTSQSIFQEEFDELFPSSTEELFNMFSGSLLGKAILMLQYYFALNVGSMREEGTMLFKSICLSSGIHVDLFDCDVNEIDVSSPIHSLNFINRVIAKIYFCRMLLFPEDYLIRAPLTETVGDPKEMLGVSSNREDLAQLRFTFINLLVSSLHKIIKRFPLVTENSEKSKSTDCLQLFRYLEVFILRNIVELFAQMRNDPIQLDSVPCVEGFFKSSLLHRFEDPTTLKALRSVLISLSEGMFSFTEVFELLLAHSQFIPSILWSDSSFDSSGLLRTGILLRPMSSILKSPALKCTDKNGADTKLEMSPSYKRKLEVIKLVRVLYHLKVCQRKTSPGKAASMNSRELLSLLLSCYGASMSELDLEIFGLMHEIVSTEGPDGVDIAEMDYLWGCSALQLRNERKLENIFSSNNMTNYETVEECQRRQFRENVPLDSKLCAATIFNFPYDRDANNGPISLIKLQQDDSMDVPKTPNIERIQRYDPAFILRFSIHSLSAGYLEPIEFAGLGLLAIAFMSLSSLHEGIRKLGYEVLGRFRNALESRRNRKDGLRIQLLLTYLQNGIAEPWQRIPSMTAIFASEASFVLLDPSHDHYHTITKLLMQSPRANLKCIPLFHTMFDSVSVSFKADRLWILRLSYAGLNSDDDAHIFKRKCHLLLSFYDSSLSDYESKMLILQIVKKSVKLPVLARYLVQHCSLISWLSSRICEDKGPVFTQMAIVLEVVNDVISSRLVVEWLQRYALEQLSELSSHAFKLLVGGFEKMRQNVVVIRSLLNVLISTLRISQKRKLYQPHFTLSFDGLYQLYQAIDEESSNVRLDLNAVLGLRVILMSAPPVFIYHMDGAKLLRFIHWGISTSFMSYSKESFLLKESGGYLAKFSGEQDSEDTPISKLLRWLTASVILGQISRNSRKVKALFSLENPSIRNLQLLLEHINEGNVEDGENGLTEVARTDCSSGEILAASILYLQQLIGIDCNMLPSVISALSLLLLSDASNNTGKISLAGDQDKMVASMCAKIRFPAEANPAWRWSYYQPWKDLSSEFTEVQKMEERHACQGLLIIFSEFLSKKSLDLAIQSYQDVNNSGVFMRERDLLTSM